MPRVKLPRKERKSKMKYFRCDDGLDQRIQNHLKLERRRRRKLKESTLLREVVDKHVP